MPILDERVALRVFGEDLHRVRAVVMQHADVWRQHVVGRAGHQPEGAVQVDADGLARVVHRLAAYAAGRCHLRRAPERRLRDELVGVRRVAPEVGMLEEVLAVALTADALHQARPRVDDARHQHLVEVGDGHVAVALRRPVKAVVERGALAEHVVALAHALAQPPRHDGHQPVGVPRVAVQRPLRRQRAAVVVDGDRRRAEQLV